MKFMDKLNISVYDFLAIFCPGVILVYLFNAQLFISGNGINIFLVCILCYLIGLIYHNALECLLKYFKILKCPKLLKSTRKEIYINECTCDEDNNEITERYDKAYYRIMRNGMLGNIPIIEAQEAFFRNIFLILAALAFCSSIFNSYCVCPYSNCFRLCWFLFFIFLAIVSVSLRRYIQKKIFKAVWAADKHLQEMEKEELGRSCQSK